MKKNEDNVSSLWDNFKHSNIHLIEVTEGEEKEQEIGNLFEEIMKEKFPNLVKEIDINDLLGSKFKTLVIRMLNKLSEVLNSINKK